MEGNGHYPEYWGDIKENMRYIIVHSESHWFLLVVNCKVQQYAVLDSLYERNNRQDKHLKKLEWFLVEVLKWKQAQRRYLNSNKQFNNYDCGIWVCKNVIAMMGHGERGIAAVDVDHYARRVHQEDAGGCQHGTDKPRSLYSVPSQRSASDTRGSPHCICGRRS